MQSEEEQKTVLATLKELNFNTLRFLVQLFQSCYLFLLFPPLSVTVIHGSSLSGLLRNLTNFTKKSCLKNHTYTLCFCF
jgi:hypothetical protein